MDREELYRRLWEAWEAYKIYAQSCINSMTFPAPFGATKEEIELKEYVADFHSAGRVPGRVHGDTK